MVGDARATGAIGPCEPIEVVVRWASALTGVLLTRNIGAGSPIAIDPVGLAEALQHELLRGWGASSEAIDRADQHLVDLRRSGPLAPVPDRG